MATHQVGALDALWLDPHLFNLNPASAYVVVEVGSDWKPQYLNVSPRDWIIVCRTLPDIPQDIERNVVLLHRGGKLLAAKLFSEG